MSLGKQPFSVSVGPGLLAGAVAAPPSKSLLHRALVCASLAGARDCVAVPDGVSDDIAATIRVLDALSRRAPECDCGESGTTLRLTVPIAAALGVETVFTGSGRLPLRPMQPYADAFKDSGAVIEFPESSDGRYLPLSVGGRLTPGAYTLPGGVSSQFVSGLLLALPLLSGDSRICIVGELQSRPYVDMTIRTMAMFGVQVESGADGNFSVSGGQRYRAPGMRIEVEADASQEAFWRLARFIGSEGVEIHASSRASSLQGDSVFAALLEALERARPGRNRPEFDVSQIPDLVPALAVAGAFSRTGLAVTHGERLRLKESDRIATTCAMLRALGCGARETADGLVVPPDLAGAGSRCDSAAGREPVVDGAGDHRIVMAAAIAGTRIACTIRGAHAVAKSYPSFFDEYRRLGGRAVQNIYSADTP